MSLEETLNLSLLLSAILLVVFVGCIFFFYRFIKTLNEKQQNLVTKNFVLLEEKTKQHLGKLTFAISSLTNSYQAELKSIKNANASFVDSQKKTFSSFVDGLNLDYQAYVGGVNATNEKLSQVIELMGVSLLNYNGVKDTLQSNYEKLASLTDRTAELISDNEEAISDFRQWSEGTFTLIQNTTKNRFAELTSEGEISLSDSVRHNEAQIKAISTESKKLIEGLFDSVHFKNFENEIEALYAMKEQFDLTTKSILEEMQSIKTEIKLEFDEAKSKDSKGFFRFLKS